MERVPVRGLVAMMLCIASPALAGSSTHIHHLRKAERIDVIVIGHDELTREVQIDRRGRITLPLIGRIKARGKTLEELQDDIAEALRAKDIQDPLVMVDLLYSRRFSIRGQVKQPGEYFHTVGMTVRMAVQITGGFTSLANDQQALLTRASDQARPPLEVKLNTRVRPGDAIEIERWRN
ncbi:MAG: polysaccharide export protein [Proteobacteria bacterium]|nr:polysaccharide export protein [Pseudomonadota bacterium]